MKLIVPESLAATLDAISESLFFGRKIPSAERLACAKWIASRQGMPGAYAGMFAPTELDRRGIHLFTGETVRSRAGISHHLGEESCRILAALQVKDQQVQSSLNRAVEGMSGRLAEAEQCGHSAAVYCCGTCSAGYWRNLANHLFPRAEERLRLGLAYIKQQRAGDGEWNRFPFYYTSLALTEIGPELAKAEMQYAAERWLKILPKLSRGTSTLSSRRATVGQRLLEMCER